MKYTSITQLLSRGVSALLILALAATMAMGQNLVIGDGSTYAGGSGIYNIKGNITNSGASGATSISGTVNLNGTSGQTIGTATKPAINFATLKATAISVKTFAVNSTVSTAIDVTSAAGSQFDIGAKKLTLQGTIANTGAGGSAYVFNGSGAEVEYAGTSAVTQSIWGGAYYKLTLTGGAGATGFNLQADATVANTFAHTGATALTVNNNLTISGASPSFATIANVSASKTLDLSGTGAKTIAAITTTTAGSAINNSGASGLLTVTALNGNAGTISGGVGGVTFTSAATNSGDITGGTGPVTFSSTLAQGGGTITAGSGDIAFNGIVTVTGGLITSSAAGSQLDFNANVANSAGAITLTGTGEAFFAGSLNSTGLTFASGSLVTYDGGSQTIPTATYGNLTIAGSASKTGAGSFGVAGNLIVNQDLDMFTNGATLTFASAGSTVSGTNEVVGAVKRTHAFTSTAYTFNSASTTVNPSTSPGNLTDFTMTLTKTSPTGYLAGRSVNRTYTEAYTSGGAFSVDIKLAYLSGDVGGANQARLRTFHGGIAKANVFTGGTYTRQSAGAGFGWVNYTGISSATMASGQQLALDDRFYSFTSIAAAVWNDVNTWDENAIPTSGDDVVIAASYPVNIPNAYDASALSVTINATSGLTVGGGASGTLTVGTGGIVNNSTGTGLTVSANGAVTITGGDLTNNGAITNAGTITVE